MRLLLALALVAFAPAPVYAGQCGFAPFPPPGCRVGPCVCDQTGQNCQWTFIC